MFMQKKLSEGAANYEHEYVAQGRLLYVHVIYVICYMYIVNKEH
jgi:hypothetical protein